LTFQSQPLRISSHQQEDGPSRPMDGSSDTNERT